MGRSVSKNSTFSMINKGLSVMFPLVTVSYVSRILGADGVGEVSSAQNLAAYFSMSAALGIPSYGVRAIAQSRNKKNKCSRIFSELFTINCISSLIATGLYLIAVFLLKDRDSNPALSLVFSGMIVFNIINIEWVYQGFEEYEYITIRSLLIKIISLLLLFIFVRQKGDVIAYAFIICFGSIGNYVLNFINLKKHVRLCFRHIKLKKHIAPIITFFVSVIAIEIYSLLDVSMLTVMSDSACVGYYSNSTKIVKAAANTLTGISVVLMPRFSYLFSANRKNEIKKLAEQFLNATFLFSIPCCIGMILVANQLVEVLFGADFMPAAATIKILAVLIVVMPLSGGVFCQLLFTSGMEKYYLLCVLSGTVVNALLNYILIPVYAQNGAAIASVIAEFTVSASMILVSRKIIRVSIHHKDALSIIFASAFMTIVLALSHRLTIGLPIWASLIFKILVACAVYFSCIFAFGNTVTKKLAGIIRSRMRN